MPFYVKPVVPARERKRERETRNVVVVILLLSSSDGNVPGIIFAKVPARARACEAHDEVHVGIELPPAFRYPV